MEKTEGDDHNSVEAVKAVFSSDFACDYDKQFEKIIAFKDALHLCIKMAFLDLPSHARILCVGAGTGDELIYLANAFPDWSFTVVEPAPIMVEQCKAKLEREKFTSRCVFHQGYLETLPPSDPFDAATSILVSHFYMDTTKRVDFFRNISSLLCHGGILVSADLSADPSDPTFDGLWGLWMRTTKFAGDTPEMQEMRRTMVQMSNVVKILPAKDIESIIMNGNFSMPTVIFQFMPIMMWCTRKI